MNEQHPIAAAREPLDSLLEPHECYWALIDTPTSGDVNAPSARAVLDESLEREVPEPLEALSVRYVRVGDRVLACCVANDRVWSAREQGALTLRPRVVPDLARQQLPSDVGLDEALQELNFLVEDFEPMALAALRRGRRRFQLGGVAAVLLLVAGSLYVNARATLRRVADAERSLIETLAGAGPLQPPVADADRLMARLRHELARIGRVRGDEARRAKLRDAGDAMAALLRAWPDDLEARVGSLQVLSSQIILSVEVSGSEDAETLAAALKGVPDWTLQPPRTEISGGLVRMSVVLRPTPAIPSQSQRGKERGS